MTTENFNHEASESEINNFMAAFCPFGYRDIAEAIKDAYNAGHDEDWAAEQIQDFMNDTDTKIEGIDPNYCVMDAILQEARTEIDNVCSYDFMNDGPGIDTYGNFMCSSYECSEEAKEELIQKLAENDVNIEDLEQATQYFLDQIEVSQSDIDEAKKQSAENEEAEA